MYKLIKYYEGLLSIIFSKIFEINFIKLIYIVFAVLKKK